MVVVIFRFDLIFLMLDPQDETYDRRLANHLVSLYYKTQTEAARETLVCIMLDLSQSCCLWHSMKVRRRVFTLI